MLNRKPNTTWIPFYLSPELERDCVNAVREYFGEGGEFVKVSVSDNAKEQNGKAYVSVKASLGIGHVNGTAIISNGLASFSMRPIETVLCAI